jgi:hypothetical protein
MKVWRRYSFLLLQCRTIALFQYCVVWSLTCVYHIDSEGLPQGNTLRMARKGEGRRGPSIALAGHQRDRVSRESGHLHVRQSESCPIFLPYEAVRQREGDTNVYHLLARASPNLQSGSQQLRYFASPYVPSPRLSLFSTLFGSIPNHLSTDL